MSENVESAQQAINQPGFFIDSHYLTDMSFENPRGPVPAEECEKIVKKMTASVNVQEDKNSDTVLLTLNLEGIYQDRVLFLCEISYCAQVRMHQIPEQLKSEILNVSVPTSLIPFLSNAIDHAAKAAGYPGIQIQEIDFGAIFAEKKQHTH